MALFGVTIDLKLGDESERERLMRALTFACRLEIIKCLRARIAWDQWMTVRGRKAYGELFRTMTRRFPYTIMPVLCCSPRTVEGISAQQPVSPEFAAAFTDEVLGQWGAYFDEYVELWNGAPLGPQWSEILLAMAQIIRVHRKRVVLGARHGPTAVKYGGVSKLLECVDAFGLWWSQWRITELQELRIVAEGGRSKGVFWITETESFVPESTQDMLMRFQKLVTARPPRIFWHTLQNRSGVRNDGLVDETGRPTVLGERLTHEAYLFHSRSWDEQGTIEYRYQ